MPSKFDVALFGLHDMPEVSSGDDIAGLILAACRDGGELRDGDILVVAQKIVSKAEGRFASLSDIEPSVRARELAHLCQKDPKLVELVLQESSEIVRCVPGVLIARHRLGFVVANAAIDQSNLSGSEDGALLLPIDPDGSARRLRVELKRRTGVEVGVIISDSFGRPWRNGTCGVAIGSAGVESLKDMRGRMDRVGRTLVSTLIGHADEIAAAASIVMGQVDEGVPAVIVRGANSGDVERPARDLVRPINEDLFR